MWALIFAIFVTIGLTSSGLHRRQALKPALPASLGLEKNATW